MPRSPRRRQDLTRALVRGIGPHVRGLWRALIDGGHDAASARLHALAWPCALVALRDWSGGRRPDAALSRALLPRGAGVFDALREAWDDPRYGAPLTALAEALATDERETSLDAFFEALLAELEPAARRRRGVYFTPAPLARFMVDALDEALREVFGLPRGLADEGTWAAVCAGLGCAVPAGVRGDARFVRVLDPAVGTGVFLRCVIERVHAVVPPDAWPAHVETALLPSLRGWELDPATHAVALLALTGALRQTGYCLRDLSHLRLELRDALTTLDREDVRAEAPVTVLVGNPPYSYRTGNPHPSAVALVDPFRRVGGDRVHERSPLSLERSLQDDFVKFFGAALALARRAGDVFALSFVTSNTYLASPMLRGVRAALVDAFPWTRVLDLHGDALRDRDGNVFGITRGVAVFTGCHAGRGTPAKRAHADLHGAAHAKLDALARLTWEPVTPRPPTYRFTPARAPERYAAWWPVDRIFRTGSTCIKTLRDALCTAPTPDEALAQVEWFRDPRTTREAIEGRFGVRDVVQWKLDEARAQLQDVDLRAHLRPYASRPFETRWMVYHPAIVGSPRREVMRPLDTVEGNVALITNRRVRTRPWSHFWCVRGLCVSEVISSADNSSCFPLYVGRAESPAHNLDAGFLRALEEATQADFSSACEDDDHVCPRCAFEYVYAVGHAPSYRARCADALVEDYPRIPLPRSLAAFRECARWGRELVGLHTGAIARPSPSAPAPEVLGMTIGTWRVAKWWAGASRGPWTEGDRRRHETTLGALSETRRIAGLLDAVVESALT